MRVLKPYEQVQLAATPSANASIPREGNFLTVTALPAAHTKGEDCFIYLLQDGKTTFLQFNDSGILPDEVYAYLKKTDVKLDAIAFDCTYGYFEKGPGRHMGYLDCLSEKTRMEKFNLLNKGCKFILTHFSHNGGLLHDEMQDKVKDSGFIVAYDGMEIAV